MRKSIGMTWIIQFVLIFILIFSAYLALSIKYSKTFKMKNEAINIIEKYQGVNNTSLILIEEYLENSGYNATGECPTFGGWIGVNNHTRTFAIAGQEYDYCLKRETLDDDLSTGYYKIKLFYKFGLPVIDDIATFEVDGETIDIPL